MLKKTVVYCLLIFFFLSSCNRDYKILNNESREKITGFFEELLLEHGGAFTLFGSKPVTEEVLLNDAQDQLKKMQEYLKNNNIEYLLLDRKFEEGWEEWKKLKPVYQSKNFILTEINFKDYRSVALFNVKTTISILEKYHNYFEEILGFSFNSKKIVYELREGKTEIWQKLLSNHKATGILYGYGLQNACLFDKYMHDEPAFLGKSKTSENNDPRLKAECYLNNNPFRIPIFVILDVKESNYLINTYQNEREKIKKKYQNKNFLELVFSKLSH